MSDEDSADEMDDDCKLMNGDVSSILLQQGHFIPGVHTFIICWFNVAFSPTGCLTEKSIIWKCTYLGLVKDACILVGGLKY